MTGTEAPMTIGRLAGKAGLAVKTVRYYSDAGILPPSGRSATGYRLYEEADLVRLEPIRTLKETGLGLATITRVLSSDLSLQDALRLRLAAIEAHAASLSAVASAIRAVLADGPDNDDLRRLQTMTSITNEERRATVESFWRNVSEGLPVDPSWLERMIGASRPDLPEEPTRAQVDAWIELSEILADNSFVEEMRETATATWSQDFDHAAFQTSGNAVAAARQAIDAGTDPTSDEAAGIVDSFIGSSAQAAGREGDEAFEGEFVARFRDQDPRAARYWELIAIIKDQPAMQGPIEEWAWISRAVAAHSTGK